MGFPSILGNATAAGLSVNRLRGRFLPSGLAVSQVSGTAAPSGFIIPLPQRREGAGDHDVSGTAPPPRMTSAQSCRIVANMSNMAALIFKSIWRLWRTILPTA
jgi:hypothetical protein